MPLYEYRCRTCDSTFDARRPMSESNEPAECPDGHVNSVRLLSVFASVGGGSNDAAQSMPTAPPRAGGGCGGHCACH